MKLRELIITITVTTIIVYGGLRTIDKDKQIVQQTNSVVNTDTIKSSTISELPCEPMRIITKWGDETDPTGNPEIISVCINRRNVILSKVQGGWDVEIVYKNGSMIACDM